MDDETQAVADARETRDLALAAALQLAKRAVDFAEEHDLRVVVLDDTLDAQGFTWALSAEAGAGAKRSLVVVSGRPRRSSNVVGSVEEVAMVMGNDQAMFEFRVPRSWVVLAASRAAEL